MRDLLNQVRDELAVRAGLHDQSKLEEPEKSCFDQAPPLDGVTYGSQEYEAVRATLGVGLTHHWQHNRHHPEYFSNGVAGMNLIDLVEMFCDWRASAEKHHDGDIAASLRINSAKYGLPPLLIQILRNTVNDLGWKMKEEV